MNEFWLVFQYREHGPQDFQGLFSSKEKAIAACKLPTFCVCGPEILDRELPEDSGPFAKCWYPLNGEAEPA